MSSIDLYLYYGREPRNDVTYEGSGKKLKIIQLKKRREINLKKLKKKIMKELIWTVGCMTLKLYIMPFM